MSRGRESIYFESLKDMIELKGSYIMLGKYLGKVGVVDRDMLMGGFIFEEVKIGVFILSGEEIPPDDRDIWMIELEESGKYAIVIDNDFEWSEIRKR